MFWLAVSNEKSFAAVRSLCVGPFLLRNIDKQAHSPKHLTKKQKYAITINAVIFKRGLTASNICKVLRFMYKPCSNTSVE